MPTIRGGISQLVGLFIDDGILAAVAVCWVFIATRMLPLVVANDSARACLLFAGLAAALLVSALRRAAQLPRGVPPG